MARGENRIPYGCARVRDVRNPSPAVSNDARADVELQVDLRAHAHTRSRATAGFLRGTGGTNG